MSSDSDDLILFIPTSGGQAPAKSLVRVGEPGESERFPFNDRLEIGRLKKSNQLPGRLLLRDATVSSRHCIVSQDPDGSCYVRDVSRNGTRVDGRRLSPNLRTPIRVGQVLSLGRNWAFRVEGGAAATLERALTMDRSTVAESDIQTVTVLVGDITDYTVMVQDVGSHALEASVSRVFEHLEEAVLRLGGTVKEFQGDAILAFWEERPDANPAREACAAVLELDRLARGLARDERIWRVDDFPLEMDWALATGKVAIHGHGGTHAVGLSMVGEPIVLAFRIEKLLDDGPHRIIACPRTRQMAAGDFEFEPLGRHRVKGFDREWSLYSLVSAPTTEG